MATPTRPCRSPTPKRCTTASMAPSCSSCPAWATSPGRLSGTSSRPASPPTCWSPDSGTVPRVLTRATITVPTADGPMELYEARPDEHEPVHGGIVVVQEAFGVNDYIEDVTCRVAELGYHAIAPHFFHR